MKIAITGATGGLGQSLVEFLCEQSDIEVTALGRNKKIGQRLSDRGAVFECGDINDIQYLKRVFLDADVVIHTAGLTSAWGEWDDFEKINIQGTKSVLSALEKNKETLFICLSSPSVYFTGESLNFVKENSPMPKRHEYFYPRSKLMADEIVLCDRPENTVLLRPRAIFGKYDQAIFPKILRIMKRGRFPLPDNGRAIVDFTAVENVVSLIWLIINSDKKFAGDIYNITNNEPMPLKDVLELICSSFELKVRFIPIPKRLLLFIARLTEIVATFLNQKDPFLTKYGVHSIATTQTLSIEKAIKELGYSPNLSISEAIKKLARDKPIN